MLFPPSTRLCTNRFGKRLQCNSLGSFLPMVLRIWGSAHMSECKNKIRRHAHSCCKRLLTTHASLDHAQPIWTSGLVSRNIMYTLAHVLRQTTIHKTVVSSESNRCPQRYDLPRLKRVGVTVRKPNVRMEGNQKVQVKSSKVEAK